MSTYSNGSLTGGLYYNISASTTWAQIPGYTYSIHYVDGSHSGGVVGTDTVSMGGITVTGTALGAANSGNSSTTTVAGLIGNAGSIPVKNSAGTNINENMFMQNIASSLPMPIFAVYGEAGTAASSVEFGYINSSKGEGYYWYGPFPNLRFPMTHKIIRDWRTPGQLCSKIASTFYAGVTGAYQLNSSTTWFFPCSTKTFPSLTMDVGGVQASVSHEINWSYWTTLSSATKICKGGIQPTTSSQMTFGEVFLASNNMVLNDATSTIQIANIIF
ncbi:aspartic peptidase domain-containing protein [Mycena olivaceomarginata]|nr:aspartic peptidase domain-containing protein [Mycena olivaceomarginata]